MLTAIRIPESFHGTSIKLLGEDYKQSISLEYSSENNIDLDIDDENHWAPRCIRAGTTALSDADLADFLYKTENATFGFFTVKRKESKNIYLMAILVILCLEAKSYLKNKLLRGPHNFRID